MYGDYPGIMKQNAGSRLPAFTKAESKMIKGTLDFVGVIHYLTVSVRDNWNASAAEHRDFYADSAIEFVGT